MQKNKTFSFIHLFSCNFSEKYYCRDVYTLKFMAYLESLSHLLRKTATKKHLAAPSYLGIALSIIEKHIGEKPEKGFIKHGVLHVYLKDHGKKMQLFQQKKQILGKIEESFVKYWYKIKIREIKSML